MTEAIFSVRNVMVRLRQICNHPYLLAEEWMADASLARACGKQDVHHLEPEDLVALTIEAAAMARVPLAGTNWIPGMER